MRVSFCFLLFAFCFPALAENGAFRSTKHGDPKIGPQRKSEAQRGSCIQCHDGHSSHNAGLGSKGNALGLFAPNDNDLCFQCHNGSGAAEVFPGNGLWMQSGHARSSSLVWPGPQPKERSYADAGKCLNCHTPHGTKDSNGIIPALTVQREEQLCNACHDGSRAVDIKREFRKQFHHPIERVGRHSADEASDPKRFGISQTDNRHSECDDCHNPHVARADRFTPSAPDASDVIAGVSRIQVRNGAAGTIPVYRWVGPANNSPALEYELCFKCHSSWTRQLVGKPDFALLTNPANPSYHPIQARGKNRRIDPAAFVGTWSDSSQLYCTDCHGSDDPRARGPHGSDYKYILKRPATTTTQQKSMLRGDLCFACHTYDVYANGSAADSLQGASRFNLPAGPGHSFHVGVQNIPCYSCHETHGSTQFPSLIRAGRSPGIVSFLQTSSGGTCVSTCHQSQTYTVNYPR